MVTGDHQACVKEFSELIARYSADVGAHNNLALCATKLRNLPYALDMMRRVVQILPNRALYRVNLALYASYAGDFATGEREASTALDLGSPLGLQPLAFAYLGRDQGAQAADTYRKFANPLTPSDTASGLGDLAVYEGRFSEAVRLLERGAAADAAANNRERAAAKLAGMAYAHLLRREQASAIAAAEKALANSGAVKIRFLAARVFVESGAIERAASLGAGLATDIQPEPQSYGKIVQGEAALQEGDARRAIVLLNEANRILDTWIGRFALGRAYLAAGMLVQADSEFDQCIKRRGEAVSLFLDEEPTYGVFPLVYYYQGRVRETLNQSGAADSYRTYLSIREKAGEDPLLPDVRRRAGL
jgi:tetratricopeptide (TPR) repeat protein